MDTSQQKLSLTETDRALSELLQRRLELGGAVLSDPVEETALLEAITRQAGPRYQEELQAVYRTILTVSRSARNQARAAPGGLYDRVRRTMENTPPLFPREATVACQGVEGAFQQLACNQLFETPRITYCPQFEDVFLAVEQGRCQYGVLPIENSTAGSVHKVYDLMRKHQFHIVRGVRLAINHNLLAKPGVRLEQVRELFSHEQAISQCSLFLQAHPEIRAMACANTAVAAQMVSQSPRGDVAAISSKHCAQLYGLECLQANIQNQNNNFTRFICISQTPQIYAGADKTSIMMTLPHRPGSLSDVLAMFAAHGVNLTKLESRPLPEREFEFLFYFDLILPADAPEFARMLNDLEGECKHFRYMGTYSEKTGDAN